MFSIRWNIDGNYPMLSETTVLEEQVNPPRPVFYEELDLFGFSEHWSYPKSKYPLLWSSGRSYYYKGIEVARVIGGGINKKPRLEVIHKGILKPIDVQAMIQSNKDRLVTLENEAKFFIKEVNNSKSPNVQLSVAYSGGKDSQVVLELVSQVLSPNDYIVVYTNTGMELPDNPQIVDLAIAGYKKRYPGLKFLTAKAHNDIIDNWRVFGTPSRMQRWCCSVAKSVPFYLLLTSICDKSSFIVFEGVRREESNSRSSYDRYAEDVKHTMVSNVRPIINWNDTEVYMYLFYCGQELNPLYRVGLTRVGCSICPFSSDWSEYIISVLDPHLNDKFFGVISESFEYNGISDPIKREKYLLDGKWKTRVGDKNLPEINNGIRFVPGDAGYSIVVNNPQSEFLEWLKIFEHHISRRQDGKFDLFIKHKDKTAKYVLALNNNEVLVQFLIGNCIEIDQSIKKLLNKVAFCVSCRLCVVECPSGAISFNPRIHVDQQKCTKCHNCIQAINKGCLVTSSRSITLQGENMIKKPHNLDRYSTFGLRESWLESHLNYDLNWIDTLGSKQIKAVKRWLLESELLDKDGQKSELANMLSNSIIDEVWGITWVNLCYNSEIVKWYHMQEYTTWDRIVLQAKLFDDFKQYSEGTLKNPLGALLNMLDSSNVLRELYGQGILTKNGRNFTKIKRIGSKAIPDSVLLYAVYRYAEYKNSTSITLSQVINDEEEFTVGSIFGIDANYAQIHLQALQEHRSKLVRVEFMANLDNVFLNKGLSATEALKIYLEGR